MPNYIQCKGPITFPVKMEAACIQMVTGSQFAVVYYGEFMRQVCIKNLFTSLTIKLSSPCLSTSVEMVQLVPLFTMFLPSSIILFATCSASNSFCKSLVPARSTIRLGFLESSDFIPGVPKTVHKFEI